MERKESLSTACRGTGMIGIIESDFTAVEADSLEPEVADAEAVDDELFAEAEEVEEDVLK